MSLNSQVLELQAYLPKLRELAKTNPPKVFMAAREFKRACGRLLFVKELTSPQRQIIDELRLEAEQLIEFSIRRSGNVGTGRV